MLILEHRCDADGRLAHLRPDAHPERVTGTGRRRVPKLSLTYRSHGVKHEPELHNSFRSIARTTRANSKSLVCPEASQLASELGFCGRDGEIRTPDPLLPKQSGKCLSGVLVTCGVRANPGLGCLVQRRMCWSARVWPCGWRGLMAAGAVEAPALVDGLLMCCWLRLWLRRAGEFVLGPSLVSVPGGCYRVVDGSHWWVPAPVGVGSAPGALSGR